MRASWPSKENNMNLHDFFTEGVAGPKSCWPGHRKVGTQPGTGKNKGKRVNDCEEIKEQGNLNEFSLGDNGEDGPRDDPYKYPKPEQYRRSIDFFGKFEANHFDKEDMDDATGVFKGYWYYGNKLKQIAYFKFDNPNRTGSNDPGMGWYYEPQDEDDLNEIAGAFPTPSHQAAMYKAAAQSNAAEAKRQAELTKQADAERLQKNTAIVDKEQRKNHHAIPTNEGDVVQFPKKHRGDISDMHECPKCGGDLQGGKYMGHAVQVCMPCKQVYLPPNSGIDQKGNKITDEGFDYTMKDLGNDYAGFASNHSLKHKFLAKIKPEKQQLYKDKMNNMHDFDQLFQLFKVAKQRGDIIEQGVAEATGDEKFDKIMRKATGNITPADAAGYWPTREYEPINLDPSYLPSMAKYKAQLYPLAYNWWSDGGDGTEEAQLRKLGWEPSYGDDYVMVVLSGIGHDGHIQYNIHDFDADDEDLDEEDNHVGTVGHEPAWSFQEIAEKLGIPNATLNLLAFHTIGGFPEAIPGIAARRGSKKYYKRSEVKRWVNANQVREKLAAFNAKRGVAEETVAYTDPKAAGAPTKADWAKARTDFDTKYPTQQAYNQRQVELWGQKNPGIPAPADLTGSTEANRQSQLQTLQQQQQVKECAMSEEGVMCPVHGLHECSGSMVYEAVSGIELADILLREFEKRYPDLFKQIDIKELENTIMDAVELAGDIDTMSDVDMMIDDLAAEFGNDVEPEEPVEPVLENKLYYNVIGTPDAQLRKDFGLRKDSRGWYLKEDVSIKRIMTAFRAFGEPTRL